MTRERKGLRGNFKVEVDNFGTVLGTTSEQREAKVQYKNSERTCGSTSYNNSITLKNHCSGAKRLRDGSWRKVMAKQILQGAGTELL